MKLDPTVVAVVVYQLVITLPLVFALVRTWITVQTNKLLISQRPTHDDVQASIDAKMIQLAGREPTRTTDTLPSPSTPGPADVPTSDLSTGPGVPPIPGGTP